MNDTNLFLPSLSQKMSFPVAIEAEHCSEQNKTFHTELNISGECIYAEVAKPTK